MSNDKALARTSSTAVEHRTPIDSMTWEDMLRMGEALVKSGILPDHLRTGAAVAAVMLTGRELGMPPMRAARSLYLVKGKVIEDAASQLARFKADGGRATFEHLDDERAVLRLRHPNGDEHIETFTLKDAKAAGLLSNATWQKFPRAMLRCRAITAGLKSLGWEGAVGTYDPDEAKHFDDEPAHEIPKIDTSRDVVEVVDPLREAKQRIAGLLREHGVDLERAREFLALCMGGFAPSSLAHFYALVDIVPVVAETLKLLDGYSDTQEQAAKESACRQVFSAVPTGDLPSTLEEWTSVRDEVARRRKSDDAIKAPGTMWPFLGTRGDGGRDETPAKPSPSQPTGAPQTAPTSSAEQRALVDDDKDRDGAGTKRRNTARGSA